MQLTAVYQKVPEGYIAFVEELPGQTLKEQRLRKQESIFKKR